MKRLKSYNQFIAESNKGVDEGIADIKGIASNPIKYTKIKNNAKKYQQTKVQIALNNVDHAKKKQKGTGKIDPKQSAVLDAANKAKNQALKDKATAVGQRMKDLATSDALKKVVTLATTKSNLAAAETALKAADGEESKQLKIRIKKLAGKASDAQQALKDYESEGGEKKEVELPGEKEKAAKAEKAKLDKEKADKEKAAAAEKAKLDKEKADRAEGPPEAPKAPQNKKKEGPPEAPKAPQNNTGDEGKDDPGAKLEADIKTFNDRIEDERTTMTKAMKDLDQAKRDLKTGRGSEEKVQKLQKAIEDSKEDIDGLKGKEKAAKKKLDALVPESFQPLEESISEKFRRLMNNV